MLSSKQKGLMCSPEAADLPHEIQWWSRRPVRAGMPHILSSQAQAGLFSEYPFTSLEAMMGKEKAHQSFQKTTLEGKPRRTQWRSWLVDCGWWFLSSQCFLFSTQVFLFQPETCCQKCGD